MSYESERATRRKQCRDFRIPVPSYAEQVEIAQRVERLLDLGKRLTERIAAAETRIARSSQAVLAKAFRGELSGHGGRV